MSGWNFLSEPFCELHSVVTVKTVLHFNHANIFLYNKEQNKVPTACHEITNHLPKKKKKRWCRWNKKWQITTILVNVTKKLF